MGMYTRCELHFKLDLNTPVSVIKPLEWLVNKSDRGEKWTECPCPDLHPFFLLNRHHQIGEDYIRDESDVGFESRVEKLESHWGVDVLTHCKNYDRQIQLFLEWIDPWVINDATESIGTYQYEEDSESSLVFPNGLIK